MSRTSRKAKEAMKRAEKEVRKQAGKPVRRKRRKRSPSEETQPRTTISWVADQVGLQGEVLHHEDKYWGVFQQGDRLITRCWTEEEWQKRKTEDQLQKSETLETEGQSSSTPKMITSTKVLERKLKEKSPTKSVLSHLLKQERWQ